MAGGEALLLPNLLILGPSSSLLIRLTVLDWSSDMCVSCEAANAVIAAAAPAVLDHVRRTSSFVRHCLFPVPIPCIRNASSWRPPSSAAIKDILVLVLCKSEDEHARRGGGLGRAVHNRCGQAHECRMGGSIDRSSTVIELRRPGPSTQVGENSIRSGLAHGLLDEMFSHPTFVETHNFKP